MKIKQLANAIAATLGTTDQEAPEGHVYAAVMGQFSLDEFQAAVAVLVSVGLLERRAGPCLVSTLKLRAIMAGQTVSA